MEKSGRKQEEAEQTCGHLAKPIADNSTEEGRAQNRRVELVKK